ncbi:hypothetical protein Tco_0073794 [Tanacetum coccineum]
MRQSRLDEVISDVVSRAMGTIWERENVVLNHRVGKRCKTRMSSRLTYGTIQAKIEKRIADVLLLSVVHLRFSNWWSSMNKNIASCGSKYLAYSRVEVEYQGSSGLLLQPELSE